MDVLTSFQAINWLSVFLASVSAFIIGGIWYGPLFGKSWMKEMGLTEEDLSQRNLRKVFGFSFLLTLVATINLALFIGADVDAVFSTTAGFFAGFGWVSTFVGILYLFGNKSLKLFLIDSGYCTIALTLIGYILGIL